MAWYQNWFGSEYYNTLYKNRDVEEASDFVRLIFDEIKYKVKADNPTILDLACGNGRHSLTLSNYGKVTGVDLSPEQIQKAKDRKISNADFFVHDMRNVVRFGYFDLVFNLFTSFGYFGNEEEDKKVLNAVYKNLKEGGLFIQDFMNGDYVLENLVPKDEVIEGELEFKINRTAEDREITKEIKVLKNHHKEGVFYERLTAYSHKDILEFHKEAGLTPIESFGDYDLSEFDKTNSPRFIIFSVK